MHRVLIINSIVCAVGSIAGLLLAVASLISIANMKGGWVGALLVAAMAVPVTFVISGIGTWVAQSRGLGKLVTALIVLPWAYGLVFVLLMLLAFQRQS